VAVGTVAGRALLGTAAVLTGRLLVGAHAAVAVLAWAIGVAIGAAATRRAVALPRCTRLRLHGGARCRGAGALGLQRGPRRRAACLAAHERARLKRVLWAIVVDAVAVLGDVATSRRDRAALVVRSPLRVGGRASDGGAGARLGDVANAGCGTADRAGVAGRMLTRVVDAVALVERARIGVRGARGQVRLLAVGRARGRVAIAGLSQVAIAGCTATHGSRISGVVLAGRTTYGAVASIGRADVAVVRAGGSCHLDRIGWADRAAVARFGKVALVGGSAANRSRHLMLIHRTRA